jgi:2-polyprenyl-6-methoxyphenol hydroxylase-like FAD-dependent oxidoreductase
VEIEHGVALAEIDFERTKVISNDGRSYEADLIVGADGRCLNM